MKVEIVKKSTPTKYEIHPLLERRWSPRTFGDMPISNLEVKTLLEAGRWAPSSNNLQPWIAIWGIKGSEAYHRIYDCLAEFNQSWVVNAPLLIMMAYETKMPDGRDNFHALHDVGLFVSNMTIQAQHMGIAAHQMAGIDFKKAKKEFKLPENSHVASAIALGYYGGDIEKLPEKLQESEQKVERERKSQIEFTFNGDFIKREEL